MALRLATRCLVKAPGESPHLFASEDRLDFHAVDGTSAPPRQRAVANRHRSHGSRIEKLHLYGTASFLQHKSNGSRALRENDIPFAVIYPTELVERQARGFMVTYTGNVDRSRNFEAKCSPVQQLEEQMSATQSMDIWPRVQPSSQAPSQPSTLSAWPTGAVVAVPSRRVLFRASLICWCLAHPSVPRRSNRSETGEVTRVPAWIPGSHRHQNASAECYSPFHP